jgi:hypothetical protein
VADGNLALSRFLIALKLQEQFALEAHLNLECGISADAE